MINPKGWPKIQCRRYFIDAT